MFIENTKIETSNNFTPKKVGKGSTHVVFVLDSSSSMGCVKDATISGFNEYLDIQRKEAKESGIKTHITLYTFNGRGIETVVEYADVSTVENLTKSSYNPNGMTNLYDAIGYAMRSVNTRLNQFKKEFRDNVIINILTDGQENSSTEYDASTIKEMVQMAESKGWAFMFLGANIDAFATGSQFGMRGTNTLQYGMSSVNDTFQVASSSTNMMKSGIRSGASLSRTYASAISDEDRKKTV